MIQGLVDTHCPAISGDPVRRPLDPTGGTQSDWAATRPATHRQPIAAMDTAGVPQAVVVQASTAHGHDKRDTMEGVAAHPGRLAGAFSIDPLDPDSPRWFRRWHGQGLSGFRLFTTGTTMPGRQGWPDDPRCDAAWATAQALRLPTCPRMTAKGIPAARTVIAKVPGLTAVLDHPARPGLSDGPPCARAAGPPLPDLVAQVQGAIAGPSAAEEAMIRGGTARRPDPALERVPA